MKRLLSIALFASIGLASFGLAYVLKTRARTRAQTTAITLPPVTAPDSVRLRALGFTPGRQVVAFVLVSSDCRYCQQADTKAAISSMRNLFRRSNASEFRSATVVGVDLDSDLKLGLDYVGSLGLNNFDEISVGQSWLNENLVRLVWRARAGPASVPQVIVVSRDMSAKLRPLSVNFGTDSVVGLLTGRKAILKWVQGGASVKQAAPTLPLPEIELGTTPVGPPALAPRS